ncbi:glycosyltransferase family 2 protein [Jannaschia marina]|uniref:glycosyltransferase family 2 protein n=1 Tax=Jannaschia marina TaxID=2741674 RepID=UPI0015C8CCF4|nr:glycosyltransferase [Jannaschia marina]
MSARAVVIIPHKDDQLRLARCLAALEVPEGVEVVVVDNGSRDPVETGTARLLREPEAGAAAARNRGVAETDAPLLFFIDSDCLPAPDWVRVALTCGDGPVGGTVEVFHETPRPLSGAQAFEAVFAFDNEAYIKRDGFSGTGNLVVSRAIFEAVGPFRGGMSEDKDWGHRAAQAGHPVSFRGDLRVGHPSRNDWPALARKWQRLVEEARLLHAAHGKSRARWILRALAMPLSAVVHTPRVLCADLSAGEKLRAVATLFRLRTARMVWMLRQLP